MLTVHHLSGSRSLRILWLLEELGAPYQIEHHQRDAVTHAAPAALAAIHPLGKSPVVTDGALTIHESGAVIDFLIRRHGGGRLAPARGTHAYERYNQWLHYAEGSAVLPLLMFLTVTRMGEAAKPLMPRIDSELVNHLGYIDRTLADRPWILGEQLSGADVNLSFVGELACGFGQAAPFANLVAWIDRIHARPAFQAAVAKGGGDYGFGRRG
jgi:glutathione S-transferase